MSNDTFTSPPNPSATPLSPTFSEDLSRAGVRKVLEAVAEREVQRVRWSAVIAGLFLAGGTKILLLLLGSAVGLEARASGPFPGLNPEFSAFTVAVALIALFVGAFSAAKLSGSVRRADGVLAGVLTWSTSMVLTLMLGLHVNMAHVTDTATLQAWFSFGGAFLSLLAAILGGAKGSVQGAGLIAGDIGARRRELRRRAREMEKKEEAQRRSAL